MGNGKLNIRVMTIMNGDGISTKYWYVFFYVLNVILFSFSKQRLLVSSPVEF